MPGPFKNHLAIDLGASNGRIVRGRFDGTRTSFDVIHRFKHDLVHVGHHLCWDWPRIVHEVQAGLAMAADCAEEEGITSISCSSWAQDFGLLDRDGRLGYPPVSYRDPRTQGMPASFASVIPPEDLVRRVGCGVTPVTALCQLKAMAETERNVLEQAGRLLFVADLIHHMLCGSMTTDWTMATASQIRNLNTGQWDRDLLNSMNIPSHFLPEIMDHPQVIGRIPEDNPIHPSLADVPVMSTAGHDTAVATACITPLERGTFFLSLGTWAMLGCCTGVLEIPAKVSEHGWVVVGLPQGDWGVFAAGTGLWLIQECRRLWTQSGQMITDDQLIEAAKQVTTDSRIDPSNPRFHAPHNMLIEIAKSCRETGQAAPTTPGEFAKVVYDSLADHYSVRLRELADTMNLEARRLSILGGGSRNAYLCDRISRAADVQVSRGPTEATATGNILIQMQVSALLIPRVTS